MPDRVRNKRFTPGKRVIDPRVSPETPAKARQKPVRHDGAPKYTAEPEPPEYVNEVWPDGGVSGPDAISVVYGERIVEGRVIAKWVAGDTKVGFVGLCSGEIDSIVSLWFTDWFDQEEVLVAYDAGYSPATGADGWFYKLGTLSQTEFSGSYYTAYGATQSFPTLCYIAAFVPQFRVQGSLVIPTERPWPGGFKARVKGRVITDTRTSTTAWSDNPAMCLRHFLLSENYGGNLGSGNIDEQSFKDAADWCDTQAFTLNIVIDGKASAKQWAETIAAHFGAKLYIKDGKYALWVEDTVSDSGILFDTSNSRDWNLRETELADRPTRVVVEYARASNNWALDQAISEVSTSTAVREASYRLHGVTDPDQAKRLADLYLKTQQTAPWRIDFMASALAAQLSLGTRFKVTFPGGCTAADFIATEITPTEAGEFRVVARQYDSSVYTPGASVPTPPGTESAGTLPSDTPPDITISGVDDLWVLDYDSEPSSMNETLYYVIEYTLPADYQFGTDLVVRGLTSVTSISSDQAWADLGDETIIPLTGNLQPGSAFRLYWPIEAGSRSRAYHPSLEDGAVVLSRLAIQVTVRLRNIIGLLSDGAISRVSNAVSSTSGGGADPGSVLQTTQELRLVEDPANGTNYWKLKPVASLSANRTLTLPDSAVAEGLVAIDGSGNISFPGVAGPHKTEELRVHEAGGANYWAIKSTSSLSADRTLTLPDSAPVVGVVAVDASGNISFRQDFSFHAHKNATSQTGITTGTATKVTFGTEDFDVGSGYDAGNSKFLPGVAGKYQINAAVTMVPDSSETMVKISLYVSGSEKKAAAAHGSLDSRGLTAAVSCVLDLGASDYVEVYVYHTKSGDGAVEGAATVTHFSGCRVG